MRRNASLFSTAVATLLALGYAWAVAGEIAIVASPASGATMLTPEQAAQVFLSKASAFPDGHRTVVLDQAEGSAMSVEFNTKVTGKDQAQLKAYWSRFIFTGKGSGPKAMPDSAAVKKAIAANPDAVGYIEKSAVDASVKVLLVVY